jgi:hypothetical protein
MAHLTAPLPVGSCQDCGASENIVFLTDIPLWNRVCPTIGILCAVCFIGRVHAAGCDPAGWRLIPETSDVSEKTLALTTGETTVSLNVSDFTSSPTELLPRYEDEEPEVELIMPFVVCTSNGGPFDDDAFVAGYQAGQIDNTLATIASGGVTELRITVYVDLLPQLELIAMRYDFSLAADAPSGENLEWTHVTFRRQQ